MNVLEGSVIYWDSSAVLSVLINDAHSDAAMHCARHDGLHIISSLGWAEVHAVLARIQRERVLAEVLVNAAREALEFGPWRLVHAGPAVEVTTELASRWPLRGADLWHLALVKTLHIDLPEIGMLTFDQRLESAAQAEDLAVDPNRN